jgi:hypothetical protein
MGQMILSKDSGQLVPGDADRVHVSICAFAMEPNARDVVGSFKSPEPLGGEIKLLWVKLEAIFNSNTLGL